CYSLGYALFLHPQLPVISLGLGIYNNDYFLYSLGAQGIEDMIFKTGAVAGYGFDVGPFGLGVSGKFALILADDPMYPFNIASGQIKNQQVLYGYTWGVDAFLSGGAAGPSGGYTWSTDIGMGLTWQPEWRFIRPKFSLDMYDMVAMVREYKDPDYSGVQDFYLSDAEPFLRHMRVGANLRFLGFLDVGAGYYLEYITWGAGVDLKIFEAFLELKTKQNLSDVGANAVMKVKF
ncbi:MAG: hypothetical protein RQ801_06100, partial [Spirochaetaceae bacterium]|nr:hypothetical protein [Spirochaetaceae bacterium]